MNQAEATYAEVIGRYTLGWWVRLTPVVDFGCYMITASAILPDADEPHTDTLAGPIIATEIVATPDQLDAMKNPAALHEMVIMALRRMWMRVASHEFEEWARLNGDRIFEPHPPVVDERPFLMPSGTSYFPSES